MYGRDRFADGGVGIGGEKQEGCVAPVFGMQRVEEPEHLYTKRLRTTTLQRVNENYLTS